MSRSLPFMSTQDLDGKMSTVCSCCAGFLEWQQGTGAGKVCKEAWHNQDCKEERRSKGAKEAGKREGLCGQETCKDGCRPEEQAQKLKTPVMMQQAAV